MGVQAGSKLIRHWLERTRCRSGLCWRKDLVFANITICDLNFFDHTFDAN